MLVKSETSVTRVGSMMTKGTVAGVFDVGLLESVEEVLDALLRVIERKVHEVAVLL